MYVNIPYFEASNTMLQAFAYKADRITESYHDILKENGIDHISDSGTLITSGL